jgi:hypothetical protein
MKYLLTLLMLVSGTVLAQTNLRTVMVDSNGVIQRPTNFWSVNAQQNNQENLMLERFHSAMSGLLVDVDNGTALVTNSFVDANIAGTIASGKSAVRLIGEVNIRGPQGIGTQFGADSHAIWVRFSAIPRNGTVRIVLGSFVASNTNVANYPTNSAIGFELSNAGGDTNRVRLIAHNGISSTNGPWVNIGTLFQTYWIGVEQSKTNGEVRLRVGVNSGSPTVNTNATITGGPTNDAAAGFAAFDAGLFTSSTNAAGLALSIYSAFVQIAD